MLRAGTYLRLYWIHATWALFVPLYLWSGTRPDRYMQDVMGVEPSYPRSAIATAIAVTAVEAAVVYLVIRPRSYHRSWRRALAALLLFVPWLALSTMTMMHNGPPVFVHLLWDLCVVLTLVGLCLSAALQALLHRGRG